MRRLIITGLPCHPESWERFFGKHPEQRILPIYEVLSQSRSADPRVLARYIAEQIESFQPESIVAHDLGVPLTLISLLRLKRSNRYPDARITLFNGAFRKFDIFKARHPFRVQLTSTRKIIREVEDYGGSVDPRLRSFLPQIRALYRRVIFFGLTEKFSELLGLEDLLGPKAPYALRNRIQIIASPNDPYIPLEAVKQLREDFPAERWVQVPYGHFPYSVSPSKIVPYINEFEAH